MTCGCKDKGTRKAEFVVKTKLLCREYYFAILLDFADILDYLKTVKKKKSN